MNKWSGLDSIIDDIILLTNGNIEKLDTIINSPFYSKKRTKILEEIERKKPIYECRRKIRQIKRHRKKHKRCK